MGLNGFKPSVFQQAILEKVRDPHGPPAIIVKAVAGSGKTTLLEEAARVIRVRGIFVANNKHIADKLDEKLRGTSMTASTVHKLGVKTLYRNLNTVQPVQEQKYLMITRAYARQYAAEFKDDPEQVSKVLRLVKFARLTLTDYRRADALHAMAYRYNLEFDSNHQPMVETIIEHGIKSAQENGDIDFTDMIWLPHALRLRVDQFQFVCVDEAQDLNAAQQELVLKCRAPGGRALFVGDPNQSIMMFSGADDKAYGNIQKRTDAEELPLSICYRCPTKIIELAQEIVPEIMPRPNAPEGTVTFGTQSMLPDTRDTDLIMCRRNAPLVKQALGLIRRGRQARVRGRDIGHDLAEVVRGIGRRSPNFERFAKAIDDYETTQRQRLNDPTDEQIEAVTDRCDAIRECYEGFGSRSYEEMAGKIEGIFADKGTAIWLSSVHRAKGLEADRTWILDYEKLGEPGARANKAEAAQEQNILYVALTRSMDTMHLISSPPKQ